MVGREPRTSFKQEMIPQCKREVSGLDHQVDQNYHQPRVASTSQLAMGCDSRFHTILNVFATPFFYNCHSRYGMDQYDVANASSSSPKEFVMLVPHPFGLN